MKHDYWGEIHPSWAGFSSETFFHMHFLINMQIEKFFGRRVR